MRHRHSEKWHHDVKEAVEGFIPLNSTPLNTGQAAIIYFPLEQLQAHTNLYLKKKGSLNSHERDRCLIALVEGHPTRDVAITACAHALSTTAVTQLLKDFPIEPSRGWGSISYLRAITGVHYSKWDAVNEVEAQLAQSLISLSTPYDPAVGQSIYEFFANWTRAGASQLFLRPFVHQILAEAGTSFTNRLEIIGREGQWTYAYNESHWLSSFLNANVGTQQFLERVIPDWRIWALWRPNMNRLRRREELETRQRQQLVDILALEGPDFATGKRSTLFEGVLPVDANSPCSSVIVNKLELRLENGNGVAARAMLNQLLNLFDTACSTSPSSLILFINTCISNPVDAETLRFLEHVNSVGIPSIDAAVLSALTANENSHRATAAIRLLPFLNGENSQELRQIFTPLMIQAVEGEIVWMQDRLCEKLQNGRPADKTARDLFVYGEALKNATWINPKLSNRTQKLLQNLPKKTELESLLNLRNDLRNSKAPILGMIDACCMQLLAGRENHHEEMKDIIEGLAPFWLRQSDPNCHAIAIAVSGRTTISSELRCQCLSQLNQMKRDLIYGISLMVTKDTNATCIEFAHLLASEISLNTEGIECWCELLLDLIKERRDGLLEHALVTFSLESWFGWMNDLRTIFRGLTMSDPPPSVLKHALHPWTGSLSINYREVLKKLEDGLGSISALRWILLGGEDSRRISPFLEHLRGLQGDVDPAIQSIMQLLAPDGSNASAISELILKLSRTSPAGKQAYLRVYDVRQKSTQDTAESVLAVWLKSADLSTIGDKSALRSMAMMLSLTVPRDSELQISVQKSADYIDSEYAALMEEAHRLESIRLSLKIHSQPKTSALLAKIGIQDPSALEDSYAAIPVGLLDVVERIDDREYEISFPLTHLKPMNRIAIGVGNAKLLLVRVIMKENNQLQKFCIHLHPEPQGLVPNASSRTHSYHTVTSDLSAQDLHLCYGRPSRISYQLCRALWQFTSRNVNGNFGLANALDSIHTAVSSFIENLAHNCIVCGVSLRCKLWRSTTCRNECSVAFRRSNLEVRLLELRLDPQVVDLLLTSVHAASVGSPTLLLDLLLKDCPVNDVATLHQVLSLLPAMTSIQNVQDLARWVQGRGSQVEALLSWVCTGYRGCLVSATEALRVPNMRGVSQFVLLNGAPELEKRFAAHTNRQSQGQVVFHGTTFDRLYSILQEGLKVNSRGQLERNGHAMGSGIYVADDPATAFGYAQSIGAGGVWTASPFLGFRVLLGCELALHSAGRGGIHVITDPSRLMVRYVFLFPATAAAPLATDMVPVLTSAYATLRLGSG